jgi:hypothetical protein
MLVYSCNYQLYSPTKAANISESSVNVLTLLTLRVYHRAATTADAVTKAKRGATSNAICFPLTIVKRELFTFSSMIVVSTSLLHDIPVAQFEIERKARMEPGSVEAPRVVKSSEETPPQLPGSSGQCHAPCPLRTPSFPLQRLSRVTLGCFHAMC